MGRNDSIQGQQLLETPPENATTPLLPLEHKCRDCSHESAICLIRLLTTLKLSIIFLTYSHTVSPTTMQINLQGIEDSVHFAANLLVYLNGTLRSILCQALTYVVTGKNKRNSGMSCERQGMVSPS